MSINCNYCGRPFASQRQCAEHELIHRNIRISCDKCSKTYSNYANLNRHQKVHKEENRKEQSINTLWSDTGAAYVCGWCQKFYSHTQRREYTQHVEGHLK